MARTPNTGSNAGGKDPSNSKVRGYNPSFEDASYFILNAEGRIFWTVFQQRLSKYMLDNQFIKLKVQKAFLHGVAGCIEHTATHWEMLQNAKKAERQIVIAWLDLENAYG